MVNAESSEVGVKSSHPTECGSVRGEGLTNVI